MTADKTAVIFDLDGTLIESHHGIVRAVAFALQKMGYGTASEEALLPFVGPPLYESFPKYFGMTETEVEEATVFYRQYYNETGIYESRLYDGVVSLLEALKAMEYPLYIASSKPEVFVLRILRHYGIDGYFHAVAGASLDNQRREKEDVLAYLFRETGIQREASVMIGDRCYDVIGARRAGVPMAIAVTYGYASPGELEKANPDFVASTPSEIPSILQKITTARRNTMETKELIANDLLKIKAVFFRPEEPFTWASGIKSPVYCDNRLTLTAPEVRNDVENGIAKTVKEVYPEAEVLMGTSTAGIAHAAIAAHILGLPMGYVRSGAKDHGRQNQIEGKLEKGQKVVVVEDLISTGGSVIEVVNVLREAGAEVLGIVSIFTYGMQKGLDRLAAANVKNVSLCDFDTIANIAAEQNYIKKSDVEKLIAFRNNPADESWIGA